MSEEINDVIEDTPDEVSPLEQEAREQGWKSKEEYEAEGKDVEKWTEAKEFVRYGKLQKSTNDRIAKIERDNEYNIRQLNSFHEAQRNQAIAELEAVQKKAVKYADEEAYESASNQIKQIQNNNQQQPQVDPLIQDWEARNPWIRDNNDPKKQDADTIYLGYLAKNPNATAAEVLDHVDKKLAKLYPSGNPMRDVPTNTEQGRRASKPTGMGLSMNDLTADEAKAWKDYGQMMFKTEKEFLKVVSNGRKK